MNLNQLQYFTVVASEGSYTAAAKKLLIQQPALSKMVSQLEESLGFEVFEKVGRNIRLTAEGEELYRHSKEIFRSIDHLEDSLSSIKAPDKGPLRICSAEILTTHVFPKLLPVLMKEYTRIHPSVFSGPGEFFLDPLKRGLYDLGLFFHLPELLPEIEIHERIPVRFYVVAKKGSAKEKIESFVGSREIEDTGTRHFPTIERMKAKYPGVKISFSSNSLSLHKGLVMAGLGSAVLPEFLVKDELRKGRFQDLYPRERTSFDLSVIKRRTKVLSEKENRMLELLKTFVQSP